MDGARWTRREILVTGNSLDSSRGMITYGKGTFVIVGAHGLILQSDSVLPRLSGRRETASGGFELSATGGVVRSYQLQASTDLAATNWNNLLSFTNTVTNFLDTTATNFAQRFYRVVAPDL